MNTEFCPPYFATDIAFQKVPIGSCGTSLIAYWIVTMSIVFVRLLGTIKRTQNWYIVNRTNHQTANKKVFPLSPMISLFGLLSYFILFILIGFNVVNSLNGFSFSLFSLCFIQISIDYCLALLKLVKLGKKVIPLKIEVDEDSNGEVSSSSGRYNYLGKFNQYGKAMFFVQMFSIFSSSLVLIILSPILSEQDIILAIIGFSFKASFLLFATIGIFYQYSRLIDTVKSISQLVESSASPEAKVKNLNAIKVLRKRQLSPSFFLTNISILLFILLAAEVIPWTWEWIILPTAGFETIAAFVQDFIFVKRRPATTSASVLNQRKFDEKLRTDYHHHHPKVVNAHQDSINLVNSAHSSLRMSNMSMTSKEKDETV